jgi:hypothetical protein
MTTETLSLADIPGLLDELRREKFYGQCMASANRAARRAT